MTIERALIVVILVLLILFLIFQLHPVPLR